ncbi:MAG: dihydrolipoyl dehydrogenase [Chloroflexi bacterium]|nr:MAG: dihydrolipoyl dehydrogenase [Chloroflexota bacterium]
MSDEHLYDLLILVGGMSYVGAIRAAQLGMNVAVIERDKMGGTCLNRGCIPSKALLETADLLHRAKELGGEFGLTNTDGIGLDPANLGKRRDAVVDKHVTGVEFLMKKKQVTVLRGHGVLTSPTSVRVSGGESGDLEASATDLILATGSAPRHLPDLTVDQDRVIDSDEALRRDELPKSVTIIGAGAIGVEWASLYGDLGSEVRLVEFMDRIVPLEDPDVSKELSRLFRKRGMAIHVSSTVDPASLQRTDSGIRHAIVASDGGGRSEVESDWILVAIGRRPVTENIGLEQIDGVKLDRGFVVVDGNMRTGVPHMYAIGDVVPGYALAHVASHESIVAVETIAGREPEPLRMDLMPRVTFCRPEIASVGLSEAEASAAGHEVKVGSFPFRALGKATIVGEVDGFAKFVADAGTVQLLGAHIIGPHAGDLLAEPTFARLVEGAAEEIAMSVHAHPTLTEVLAEAALAVDGAALHV